MKDTNFVYAVSRVRSQELRLLSVQDFEQLLSMNSVDACLRLLRDKGWEEGESVEGMLRAETEKTWSFITEICDERDVFDILFLRNDFHNLKAQIKSTLTGALDEGLFLEPAGVDPARIREAVTEKEFETLPPYMAAAAKEAFDVLLSTRDGQLCDVILDRAQMEAVARFGRESDSRFVDGYAQLYVALSDIKIAVRAQMTGKTHAFLERALAPCDLVDVSRLATAATGSRDGLLEVLAHSSFSQAAETFRESPSAFEKWCDDKIIDYILSARYMPFGVEPLFAYILARENEIKMMRIVLSGVYNDLPKQSIRERLRDLYV